MKKTVFLAFALSALSAASFAQSQSFTVTTTSSEGNVYGGDGSGINDPLIRKRANDYAAKQQYKSDTRAAKEGYKDEQRAAKERYREQRQEARRERSESLNSSGSSGTQYEGKAKGAND